MQRFLVPKFYLIFTLDGQSWESWSTSLYDYYSVQEEVRVLKARFKMAIMLAPEIDWKYIPEYDMHKIFTN